MTAKHSVDSSKKQSKSSFNNLMEKWAWQKYLNLYSENRPLNEIMSIYEAVLNYLLWGLNLHRRYSYTPTPNFSSMLQAAYEPDFCFLSHTFLLSPPHLFLCNLHFLTYEEVEFLELAYPNTPPSYRADYRHLGAMCVHDQLILFSGFYKPFL